MLKRVGQSRYRAESVQAHVELSLSGPIWSLAGPGQYRNDRVRVDVEPSGLGLVSCRVGPSQC